MYKSLIAAVGLLISMNTLAQEVRPLYTGKVPNAIASNEPESKTVTDGGHLRYSKVQAPTIEIYLPKKSKSTGAAVVIVPGGAYGFVSYTNEGTDVAKAFNNIGVAAFILKYRLPSDKLMVDKTIGPLQDAQKAIKVVRMGAKAWGIDTAKVGIIGFSAGGHLASTAGTHFNKAVIDNPEKINLKPSFMILVFPVISFKNDLTHLGSRNNLIGMSPNPTIISHYSNELQVTAQTPPTMLIHTADDETVKVENSLRFYEALLNCKVPTEMHLYHKGGHGFGLKNRHSHDNLIDRIQNWLKTAKFIPSK